MIRSGRPGRVQVVEAKLKDNLTTGESWRLDNRMGGGSLSLLAAYVTDTGNGEKISFPELSATMVCVQ